MMMTLTPKSEIHLPKRCKIFATIDATPTGNNVIITLEGTIIGAQSVKLKHFLRTISEFPAETWIFHLSKLDVLSVRGIRTLTQFAEAMRQTRGRVQIQGINPALLFLFREMGLVPLFDWLS